MKNEKLKDIVLLLKNELIQKKENMQLSIHEKEHFIVHFVQSLEQDTLAINSENGRSGITYIVNRFNDITTLYNGEGTEKFEQLLLSLTAIHIKELVDKQTVSLNTQ